MVLMLVLDLGVFHRKARAVGTREALAWTLVWVSLALVFGGGLWVKFGSTKGLEFLTGYVIEWSLSVDNLFVFLVIFSYFAVPAEHQHGVLFWGILAAVVLRGAFIFVGTALVQAFDWVLYVFGAFLAYTGLKLLVQKQEEMHPERNPALRWLKRLMPITHEYHGSRFVVRVDERLHATPLLVVLVVVNAVDVVFAADSIPAIFGITTDAFIVFTSNLFAVLGLRSVFFLLSGIMGKFHYLRHGLALVLAFIGVKMLVAVWVHVPVTISLAVVGALLGGSVLLSLLRPPSTQT